MLSARQLAQSGSSVELAASCLRGWCGSLWGRVPSSDSICLRLHRSSRHPFPLAEQRKVNPWTDGLKKKKKEKKQASPQISTHLGLA